MAGDTAPGYDYDQIYREYAPKVRAVARRRLAAAGRDVSEDVVQEVFIRAYRALPALDLDRPLWPWLRRVAVNVCNDVLKSPRTWAEQPVDVLPESEALAEVDPVSLVVASEQRQAISDALDVLSPRQREVLLRRVVDGVTTEAMADAEGSSIDAVKSAVKRGRHMFRRAYTDIAGERGLLGGAHGPGPVPALPDRLRTLGARLRSVYDACARACNSPGWQAVPVALSAAVLLFGWGASRGGNSVAGALPEGWGRDQSFLEAAMDIASAADSSTGATRPGGGAPPSSPPGQNRGNNDKERQAWIRGNIKGGFRNNDKQSGLYVEWRNDYPEEVKRLSNSDGKGDTLVAWNVDCTAGPVIREGCRVARSTLPGETDHQYVYWR